MTSTIISSIVLFLGVSILLVVILLVAKKYLVPSGKATITINNDKQIEVETGSSLLSTLSNEKIFLPSACGGGGSCAQCRCQVLEGGGEILPTEQVHFSRKQQLNHWRLGCQVKVKSDMSIKIDESVLGVKEWECEVSPTRTWLHLSKSLSWHCLRVNTWTLSRVLTHRSRYLNSQWITIRTLTRALSVMSICLHGRNSVCWA